MNKETKDQTKKVTNRIDLKSIKSSDIGQHDHLKTSADLVESCFP